jgi:tight adherence protein C
MILILAFLGSFGVIASAGLLLFYRDAVLERLSTVVAQRTRRSFNFLRPKQASIEQIIKPFQNMVPRSAQEVSILEKRLLRAGYRQDSATNIFYAAKVLVPVFLTLIATVTKIYQAGPFFVYAITAGVGFLVPDFWLGNRINKRKMKLQLGLPEALDLMVICSEAGLGLDQTIARVAAELKLSQSEISDELNLFMLEQKAGRARDEAFKNLADRTDIDSIRALSTTLIQADTFGTSISKTLRVYSDTLRTQRRQRAEEQAAKTTVKLVFPLVLFIFPSLFVVALGPAMITMFEGFEKYLQ